jgi:hypothetical protein
MFCDFSGGPSIEGPFLISHTHPEGWGYPSVDDASGLGDIFPLDQVKKVRGDE